jgi:hypothetical protein
MFWSRDWYDIVLASYQIECHAMRFAPVGAPAELELSLPGLYEEHWCCFLQNNVLQTRRRAVPPALSDSLPGCIQGTQFLTVPLLQSSCGVSVSHGTDTSAFNSTTKVDFKGASPSLNDCHLFQRLLSFSLSLAPPHEGIPQTALTPPTFAGLRSLMLLLSPIPNLRRDKENGIPYQPNKAPDCTPCGLSTQGKDSLASCVRSLSSSLSGPGDYKRAGA